MRSNARCCDPEPTNQSASHLVVPVKVIPERDQPLLHHVPASAGLRPTERLERRERAELRLQRRDPPKVVRHLCKVAIVTEIDIDIDIKIEIETNKEKT